jgi:hypothetical protein
MRPMPIRPLRWCRTFSDRYRQAAIAFRTEAKAGTLCKCSPKLESSSVALQ